MQRLSEKFGFFYLNTGCEGFLPEPIIRIRICFLVVSPGIWFTAMLYRVREYALDVEHEQTGFRANFGFLKTETRNSKTIFLPESDGCISRNLVLDSGSML